jgi:hypothetical protein
MMVKMVLALINIVILKRRLMKKGYHKTKSGKTAKKGLYYNINKRKKAGTSRSKSKSTISAKSYKSMLSGFKK